MLLKITTTHQPATDLGYLLHKNPNRVQSFALSFGKAHVFYPEATEDRCTVALLLEVDPVGLVRTRRGPAGADGALERYVNDRPYVASSFMSVAIGQVFRSALAGRSADRPDLVSQALPLRAEIAAVPCRGGEGLLRRLFEPLGYTVRAENYPLDEHFPDWGDSPYFTIGLESTVRLQDLLAHLYVLIPVLDDDKHYWVTDDEVEKLLRHGAGWLDRHPEREEIAGRYLRHKGRLTRSALARLTDDDISDPDAAEESHAGEEAVLEAPLSLNQQRLGSALTVVKASGAKRVLDLGCGEGRFLDMLLNDRQFEEIVGMDVSHRALEHASQRLHYDTLPDRQKSRIKLIQGSLTYYDKRLSGYDAATVIEVIEHFDPSRLRAFERALFEFARPATVVVTTPNAEYNVLFEHLPAGNLRHQDHRFEWSRKDFQRWGANIADRFGYSVQFHPVGLEDTAVGPPTQMGVFQLL